MAGSRSARAAPSGWAGGGRLVDVVGSRGRSASPPAGQASPAFGALTAGSPRLGGAPRAEILRRTACDLERSVCAVKPTDAIVLGILVLAEVNQVDDPAQSLEASARAMILTIRIDMSAPGGPGRPSTDASARAAAEHPLKETRAMAVSAPPPRWGGDDLPGLPGIESRDDQDLRDDPPLEGPSKSDSDRSGSPGAAGGRPSAS